MQQPSRPDFTQFMPSRFMHSRSRFGLIALVRCFVASYVGASLVAGCGAPKTATPAVARDAKTSGLLPQAARAIRIARTYDRGIEAARRDDETAFVEACRQLRALQAMPESLALASGASLSEAEKAVSDAIVLDNRARQAGESPDETSVQSARGDALNEAAEAETTPEALRLSAAREYRRALRLSPRFDSPDPAKLNALAYFLAERGARKDFQTGENLARRAITMLDEAIAQAPARGYRTEWWQNSRAVTRDTLAWALFRQNKLDEALREQQKAVSEFDATNRSLALLFPSGALPDDSAARAELLFHLGEILRVLGRTSQARTQFQAALKADPTHELSRQSLRALDAKPNAKSSP